MANTFWNPPVAKPETIALLMELASGFEGLDTTRISNLLMDQLCFSYEAEQGSDMHRILDAIRSLETGEPTNVKEASEFKYPPLAGLWHVHYVTARFLAKNLALELEGKRTGRKLEAKFDATLKSGMTSEQMAAQIAHDATWGAYLDRSGRNALTGEWVIYAVDHSGRNHYLLAAEHPEYGRERDGDLAIYNLMKTRCEPRFAALLPQHDGASQ